MMELSEVGTRLGLENRTLRYVMEQELVPGLAKVNQGRGTRRQLTLHQARLVGLASLLHQSGIRGDALKATLKKGRPALHDEHDGFFATKIATNEDAINVTLRVDVRQIRKKIA